MSLKGKIEAIVYAAEEPVTLAQLVGLLGAEAQAELEAEAARQGQLTLLGGSAEAGDPEALNAETLGDGAEVAVSANEFTGAAAEGRARERESREYLRAVLEELVREYREGDRGLEIREIAGGYRFATKPEYHDAVRGVVRSLKPPLKLSLPALETLAVVAYKQPVTAPEVSEIRGVDSAGVLGSLLGRKLVAAAGRKQVIGRPILYRTTKEFLLRFGLKDVNELPSIEEFERLASELNEAVQEESPMVDMPPSTRLPVSVAEVAREEPMRDEHSAQADGVPEAEMRAEETSAEHLTPAPEGPGEFTGDENAPPADNAAVDGRISGVPPSYDTAKDEMTDSSAHDAEVQREEQLGNRGSDD